jgi:hypothetical protein
MVLEHLASIDLARFGIGATISEITSKSQGQRLGVGVSSYAIGHTVQHLVKEFTDRCVDFQDHPEVAQGLQLASFVLSIVAASAVLKRVFNRGADNTKPQVTDWAVMVMRTCGETALTLLPVFAHSALTRGCAVPDTNCPPELTSWDPLNVAGLFA